MVGAYGGRRARDGREGDVGAGRCGWVRLGAGARQRPPPGRPPPGRRGAPRAAQRVAPWPRRWPGWRPWSWSSIGCRPWARGSGRLSPAACGRNGSGATRWGTPSATARPSSGRALQAGTPPGVDGPDGARRLVGGRPCGGDLVRPRREVAQSLERPGGVPREEVAAFHRGVRGGATAVWEAVRADVMGRDEADPAEEAAPGGAASGSSTTPPSPGTPPHRREGASRRPAGCLQAAGRHQRDGDRPQRQQPQHSAGSPRNGVPGRNSA